MGRRLLWFQPNTTRFTDNSKGRFKPGSVVPAIPEAELVRFWRADALTSSLGFRPKQTR